MILQTEYAERRKHLMHQVDPESVIIIPAASKILRTGDTAFSFRQNSDFYYLTGFKEPQSILVLIPNHPHAKYHLFVRERDPHKEVWDGKMQGLEGVLAHFLVEKAHDIRHFQEILPLLLQDRKRIYYPMGKHNEFDKQLFAVVNQLRHKVRAGVSAPEEFHNIEPFIHEMRLRKSPAEIALMQKAADISVEAHLKAMQICQPEMKEYQLEAALLQTFYAAGSRHVAYTPIIGSGENTCILHYVENDQVIKSGDLVLIDAGAEYDYYCADITRTFPANGQFTKEQAAIYDLVLEAQVAAIEMIKPNVLWHELQLKIIEVLTQGLVHLGLLTGDINTLIAEKAVSRFYMHNSGHWLGLDTHDVGSYKVNGEWRPLEAGFVLTVEPGIYIPANLSDVDQRWWNIGIRIEDDVLVTESGAEVLTKSLPKTREAIEALMR